MKHGLDWRDVHDAIVCVRGLRYVWHEHQERGRGYPEGMRYLVRQRIFSFADSFWITDEDGNEVFHVDGHALQFRKTFELTDRNGVVVAMIRQQLFRLREQERRRAMSG